MRAGRVRFRAAQVVLPVAVGDAEPFRVERAANETVRALEALVAEARGGTAERERQMRARHRVVAPAPKRVALLLAAAIQSVRARVGMPIADGRCLAVIAAHFLRTWGLPTPRRSSSQRARERDGWACTVPGCSRTATHSHHVLFRSRGGDRTALTNQTGVCAVHHLRCIHGGYLRVFGEAPDRLAWVRGGNVWTGIPEVEAAGVAAVTS